jgi:nitrate reductase NapE
LVSFSRAVGRTIAPTLTVTPRRLAMLHDSTDTDAPSTRTEEWRSFLFFTVVMAPVLAFMIVGGYGFTVWMYQLLIAGPPHG